MKMDWVSRHEQFYHLKASLTIGPLMQAITGLFGPDDLLSGTCTGSDLPIPVIISADKIAKVADKVAMLGCSKCSWSKGGCKQCKNRRQLTIHDFFVKKKKQQRQLTIYDFFVKKTRP
jgi:hypothetical protein